MHTTKIIKEYGPHALQGLAVGIAGAIIWNATESTVALIVASAVTSYVATKLRIVVTDVLNENT